MQNNSFWPADSVIYHIYPRSFQDSNGDGIGDIKGIIQRLDYLAGKKDSLGVDAIWLSPIYLSPMNDFGYDISDHTAVDPIFGTLDDFDELVLQAHKRGLKVLMDFVPNHTSIDHSWFKESASSTENPKRDWYIWQPPKPDGTAPTNWLSVFGGSAWKLDETTGEYYLHSFDVTQPDLNWRNPQVVKEMLNILKFWLARGVDGFRVDAVYFLFKDTQFLDEPPNPTFVLGTHEPYDQLMHPYTFAQPEVLDMLKQFSDVLAEFGEKFMVTEVYTSLDEIIKMYTHVSSTWYAPFNFALISLPWRPDIHKKFIDEYDTAVGHLYLPTYVIGNHDKPRVSSRIHPDQARAAAMLLLTLRGMPFIYYGDEIGMQNVPIPHEYIQDPWEKNMPGLGLGRDPARTPMQWDNSNQSGFTNAKPWLPLADSYKTQNVATESSDSQSMLSLHKTLLSIRKQSAALKYGKYASWDTKNEFVFAFTRTAESEVLLIIVNYSDTEQTVHLPFHSGKLLCTTYMDKKQIAHVPSNGLTLRPNEGYLMCID
jgi:alpha-glucosidase